MVELTKIYLNEFEYGRIHSVLSHGNQNKQTNVILVGGNRFLYSVVVVKSCDDL